MSLETAVFEIHDGEVVFTDGQIGAVLLDKKYWYPFRYFEGSMNMDISDLLPEGHFTPVGAFKMAMLEFT